MCVFAGFEGEFVEVEGEGMKEVGRYDVVDEGMDLFGGGLVVYALYVSSASRVVWSFGSGPYCG